jgi:hypothetical protein
MEWGDDVVVVETPRVRRERLERELVRWQAGWLGTLEQRVEDVSCSRPVLFVVIWGGSLLLAIWAVGRFVPRLLWPE